MHLCCIMVNTGSKSDTQLRCRGIKTDHTCGYRCEESNISQFRDHWLLKFHCGWKQSERQRKRWKRRERRQRTVISALHTVQTFERNSEKVMEQRFQYVQVGVQYCSLSATTKLYVFFHIDSVWTGFTTTWKYFYGWNWVQSDQKEEEGPERDWPLLQPLARVAAMSRDVLPSAVMGFSNIMQHWGHTALDISWPLSAVFEMMC